MNLRKLSAMIVVLLIAFAYTIYSPAMAYQPANQPRFEKHQRHQDDDQKKDKKGDQHNDANHDQHHDQDKDHDQNNNHHDDQNHGDKNKRDNNDQHHHSDQDKSDNKEHKHGHDDNQQDNHKHHDDQHHDQNHNDRRHGDNKRRHSHHQHHSWWDRDRESTVIIFGLADEGAQERSDARHVLHRTAVVLEHAQQMARQDTELYKDVISQNRPGLGRAFTHQMLARELFQNGHYQEATFHSLHARVIALRLMEQMQDQADLDDNGDDSFANEDLAIEGSNLDDLETGYWDRCPAESQMTFGMNEWNVSDDDALSVQIELNF